MPTTIHLQGSVLYGALPLWILLCILISPFVMKKVKKRKLKKQGVKETAPIKPAVKKVPLTVKDKYVQQLNGILLDYKGGKRDERESYQLLSFFLREFFNEYAGIDVTRKTLAEIRGIHNSRLEKLIEEFYACEFAPDSNGNIEGAIKRTIQAIENW